MGKKDGWKDWTEVGGNSGEMGKMEGEKREGEERKWRCVFEVEGHHNKPLLLSLYNTAKIHGEPS